MEEKLTYREFLEWVAFLQIEFKEYEKTELYLARVCHTIASCWSKSKLKMKDFLFDFGRESDKKDPKVLQAKMKAWAKSIKQRKQ